MGSGDSTASGEEEDIGRGDSAASGEEEDIGSGDSPVSESEEDLGSGLSPASKREEDLEGRGGSLCRIGVACVIIISESEDELAGDAAREDEEESVRREIIRGSSEGF